MQKDSKRYSCTLLIAVRNELECMRVTMPKVDRSLFDRIVFVDGNSTDGTVQYILDNGYEWVNEGQAGLRRGLAKVIEESTSELIMTFSPDGNCPPEDIPRLLEAMEKNNCDMVIASRYLDWAKSWDDTLTTKIGNFFFNGFINLLVRGHYTDCMTNFRVYKKDFVKRIRLLDESLYSRIEKLMKCPVSIEPILSYLAARHDGMICEIPSHEPKRLFGEEKVNKWRWGFAYLLQILTAHAAYLRPTNLLSRQLLRGKT